MKGENQRLSSVFQRLAWVLAALCACRGAEAQATEHPAAPGTAQIAQVPRVPGVSTLLRGVNAGVTFSGVHDSSIGWYTVATPAVFCAFSSHYSADASFTLYPSRNVIRLVQSTTPGVPPTEQLVLATGELSDTFIGLHGAFNLRRLRDTVTASFTLPTGNNNEGLGAGKVTYDFSDHLERSVRRASLLVDIGAGNSSGLFNRLVTNDYTSVGTLAHFQQGVVLWPFRLNSIQSVLYEQLPIGNQTIYASQGPPGSQGPAAVTGNGIGHDVGVTTSVGIPLTAHLTLSGYYNRSFEQNLDTVSMGVTYVLRGRANVKKLSMIDRALREAEKDAPPAHY